MLGTLLLQESLLFGPIVFAYQILLLNESGVRYVFKPFCLGHVNVITLIFFYDKSVEKFEVDSVCMIILCRKQDHIFHFTTLIYYILTHLFRSIFRRKEKTKLTLPGRKRASGRAKYHLYVFQQTYIEETMFSCHPQLRLRVHQSYIIINQVTFWSKPFFPQLHYIIALKTVPNMKATLFQSGEEIA